MADESITVDRSYVDNYSVKEFATYDIVPKYFDEEEVSDRTVGMLGYTTELISQLSEDAFNAGSVFFRESFPNRAEIPESIYSHAAIFQLSDVFATASACKMLLVLDETAVIKNMVFYKNDLSTFDGNTIGMYRFYIDKDTIITINEEDYSLDYDIQLNIVKKKNDKGEDEYLFTGRYMMPGYTGTTTTQFYENSISELIDPYVKIRRSGDGFLALEVDTHQMYRDVIEEEITSNTVVNYSTIDVTYVGQLAGFDVLYKDPNSNEWQQLDTKVIYSQPSSDPFCYYQFVDDDKLKISFNSEDNYFTPEFNAKLRIILYMTDGAEGNFDLYEGTNITIDPCTDNYQYTYSYLSAAKPIGASLGGLDQGDLDDLQAITVENYRTATALTTENDLQEFFNNYKYYYGDSDILFVKKRNDIFERVYSPFIVMRKDAEYIYNTNTLKLHLNVSDMSNPETNVYMLEPGYLFTCNENNGYAEFYRNTSGLNIESPDGTIIRNSDDLFNDYKFAVENDHDASYFIENAEQRALAPDYLQRHCSFAEYKRKFNLDDKMTVFALDPNDYKELDDPNHLKFLVMNPFLIYFRKNPNIVSTYMTYVNNNSLVDFTAINDTMYVQFNATTLNVKRDFEALKRYKISITLTPNIKVSTDNPIIAAKRSSDGTFIDYIYNDKYGVENNSLRVIMEIRNGKQSVCFTELVPESYDSSKELFTFSNYIYTDDHISSDSRLRILDGTIYRFYSDYTDTFDGKTIEYHKGEWFEVHPDDHTKFTLYYYDETTGKNRALDTNVPVNTVTHLRQVNAVRKFSNVINMSSLDDILIPMTDVVCKVYTIVNQNFDSTSSSFVKFTSTNNKFASYDDEYNDTYEYYQWTNEYTTGSYAIDFLKPLNSVRTHVTFDDFKEEFETGEDGNVFTLWKNPITGHYYRKPSRESETYTEYDFNNNIVKENISQDTLDIITSNGNYITTTFSHELYDIQMYTIGFMRASIFNNKENLDYFMNSFASHYDFLLDIINTRLRNETNMDVKFYNTYGRSTKITIGEENEILDTVNLSIEFDMWFASTTDLDTAIPELKAFIKKDIETLNTIGMNNIYVSNLMRKIENNFSYVDHIRFVKINDYISTYQTVRSKFEDLHELDTNELREFVPELMCINLEDIKINEHFI